MKKDILIAITLFAMVVSVCCVYTQYRTIRRQKAELVKYKAVIIDYDLLDIIVYEEMKMDTLNERRWQELVDYYEMYKEGTLWDDL